MAQQVEASVLAIARQRAGTLADEWAWTLVVIEFRVNVVRHPELNTRFADLHCRLIDGIVVPFEQVFQAAGTGPAEQLADSHVCPMPRKTATCGLRCLTSNHEEVLRGFIRAMSGRIP